MNFNPALVIALLLTTSLSAAANTDRVNDLLELDLPSLNRLSLSDTRHQSTGAIILANLNADIIQRSGAKNLNELLSLYIPKQTRLNKNQFILQIDYTVMF